EGVAPEGAVVGQPLVDGPQRAGVERVGPAPALGPDPGEAGVPQHLELLRDGRLGDAELGAYDVDDLARAELALGEQLHDAAPYRVTEDRERVHAPLLAPLAGRARLGLAPAHA